MSMLAPDLRVLIVADDPLARAGLATLVAALQGCFVVGQIAGDTHMLAGLEVYGPDVVLWDMGWESQTQPERLADLRDAGLPLSVLRAAPKPWCGPPVWDSSSDLVLRTAINVPPVGSDFTALAAFGGDTYFCQADLAIFLGHLLSVWAMRRRSSSLYAQRMVIMLVLSVVCREAEPCEGLPEEGVATMTGVLLEVSDALAATVESAGAGVVRVEGRRRLPATGIVWSPDGIIVTAHHVVEQDDAIQVGLPAGQRVAATLVGRDPSTDLAVLRAEATDLAPPAWVEPDLHSLRVGHLVLALGRPGQTVQATLGIVSALGSDWRTPAGGQMERYLQTDVVMYPGFSGGPLVDAAGRVVGLNTSAVLRSISLTVAVPTLRRVVEMLLTHGRVRRGYLGVSTQPVRLPQALAQQLGQETGLLLILVEPESPAEQGGFLLGDTLVALDATPLRQPDDLLALLSAERIGSTGRVRIIRSGEVQERPVVIGERS